MRHECSEILLIMVIKNVAVVIVLDEVHRCADILRCQNEQSRRNCLVNHDAPVINVARQNQAAG